MQTGPQPDAATVCMQFYNNSQSVLCANGLGPTSTAPYAWNNVGSPYGPFRSFARCKNTMAGARYVTIQYWRWTSTRFAFSNILVLRNGEASTGLGGFQEC